MKDIILPNHQNYHRNLSYSDPERMRYNRIKINIVLISTILGVCVTMRMSDKKTQRELNENTKQRYFDAPKLNQFSKFNYSQVA